MRSPRIEKKSKYASQNDGGDEQPEDRRDDLAQPDVGPGRADPDRDERLAERDDHHEAVALREVRRVQTASPSTRSATAPT